MKPPTPRVLMAVANLSALNTGMGGHYHSTRTIFSALRNYLEIELIVIGHAMPPALADIPGVTLVSATNSPSANSLSAIRKLIKTSSSNVVHCMDASSLLFCRLASLGTNTTVVWTKCGGHSLRRYTPLGSPDTVFHSQDRDHYSKKDFDPQLIPNRIELDQRRTIVAPQRPEGPLRLVRVSRICEKYEAGLAKTIRLARAGIDAGLQLKLDLIGHPEDPAVLARLAAIAGPETRFLTTSEWTAKASEHLIGYDVAIGGGRAAMEALAAGLPTFSTPDRSPAPVLIESANLEALLDANMSERAACSGDMPAAVSHLSRLASPETYDALSEWAAAVALSRLDVRAAVPQYLSLYNQAIQHLRSPEIFDLAQQWLRHEISIAVCKITRRQTKSESAR